MTDQPHKSSDSADTPEGHTKEEPTAAEIGKPGTPGSGATPEAPHAADAELMAAGHAPADPAEMYFAEHDPVTHMDGHSAISDDDHGHADMALGPIDWRAWGLALFGAAAGVIVLACFAVALAS